MAKLHTSCRPGLQARGALRASVTPGALQGSREKGCTYIQQQGCAQGYFWQLYTITTCLQPIAISDFQTAQVGLES